MSRTTRPRHSRYVALMGSWSQVLVPYCCGSTMHSSMSALEARAAMPLKFHTARFGGAGPLVPVPGCRSVHPSAVEAPWVGTDRRR